MLRELGSSARVEPFGATQLYIAAMYVSTQNRTERVRYFMGIANEFKTWYDTVEVKEDDTQ